MPFWFTLVMMMMFSALPAATAWVLVQKLSQIARIIVSMSRRNGTAFVFWDGRYIAAK